MKEQMQKREEEKIESRRRGKKAKRKHKLGELRQSLKKFPGDSLVHRTWGYITSNFCSQIFFMKIVKYL